MSESDEAALRVIAMLQQRVPLYSRSQWSRIASTMASADNKKIPVPMREAVRRLRDELK